MDIGDGDVVVTSAPCRERPRMLAAGAMLPYEDAVRHEEVREQLITRVMEGRAGTVQEAGGRQHGRGSL